MLFCHSKSFFLINFSLIIFSFKSCFILVKISVKSIQFPSADSKYDEPGYGNQMFPEEMFLHCGFFAVICCFTCFLTVASLSLLHLENNENGTSRYNDVGATLNWDLFSCPAVPDVANHEEENKSKTVTGFLFVSVFISSLLKQIRLGSLGIEISTPP